MKKNIDNMFKTWELSKIVRSHIELQRPTPNHSDISFVDWLEQIWKKKIWYIKYCTMLEKLLSPRQYGTKRII